MIKQFKKFIDNGKVKMLYHKYGIKDYHTNTDRSIDVYESVNLSRRDLLEIPLKFRQVDGWFSCRENQLTTLVGCPERVNGHFTCDHNKLQNLEGCPKYVYDYFNCQNNNITTFEGGPKHVEGEFWCDNNPIYPVFELINPDWKWNNMDFFNELDIIREDQTLVLMRLNAFLQEFGKDPVELVKGWKLI